VVPLLAAEVELIDLRESRGEARGEARDRGLRRCSVKGAAGSGRRRRSGRSRSWGRRGAMVAVRSRL
jgi:hypothetical protein